jgi:phage terminase large subunit-like protein
MDEEVIPLPSPDITPPVTKINFICATGLTDWLVHILAFPMAYHDWNVNVSRTSFSLKTV